ncbi:MAG: hypothetical protein AB4062_16325 [Crocosphaera sp.]
MSKTAILFNGAASYISQEAGMLDLLMGNVPGVSGFGLNFTEDVTFIGGLSSGSLMTFATNLTFSKKPSLTWENFKETILFPLTTAKVYSGSTKPYDTTPLKKLLTEISNDYGVSLIENLPFDSAIITTTRNIFALRHCWLTNIVEVSQKLPHPSWDSRTFSTLRQYQSQVELVSALMCSTAIPHTFPSQSLYYRKGKEDTFIPSRHSADQAAEFVDGGLSIPLFGVFGNGVFAEFETFFKTYNQHFDKIYIISPNFVSKNEKRDSLEVVNAMLAEEEDFDPQAFLNHLTTLFLDRMKKYNSDQKLASKIYFCKPGVTGYDPLDFSQQEPQYNDTIEWGKNNPSQIAIDINSL